MRTFEFRLANTSVRPEMATDAIAASQKPNLKKETHPATAGVKKTSKGGNMTRVMYRNGTYDYVLTSQVARQAEAHMCAEILPALKRLARHAALNAR